MLKYKIENNEVTITGYKDQFVKSIVIPDTIEGYPVTRIRSWCFTGRNNLKRLVIPNSVTDIGYRLGCKNLKFINNVRLNNKGIIVNNRFINFRYWFYRVTYIIGCDCYYEDIHDFYVLPYIIDGEVYSLNFI